MQEPPKKRNSARPFCWQPAVGKFAKFIRHGKLLRRYTTLGFRSCLVKRPAMVSACGTIDHRNGTQGCMMPFCKSKKKIRDSARIPPLCHVSPDAARPFAFAEMDWYLARAHGKTGTSHPSCIQCPCGSNGMVPLHQQKGAKIGILLTDGYCCQRKNVCIYLYISVYICIIIYIYIYRLADVHFSSGPGHAHSQFFAT